MNTISILLVDDQTLFVESLKVVLLKKAKHIKVVGIAGNGEEALALVEKTNPNIVLMDVRMPVMNGVEATRLIRQTHPGTQVVILTNFDDDEYVGQALHYGAVGYLLKDMPLDNLIASIEAVKEGAVLISKSVAAKIVNAAFGDDIPRENASIFKELSKREVEVLNLLSKGRSNKEIAAELFISEQTVKNHVSVIYSKIGARDRIHAMKLGRDSRLSIFD